MINRRSALSYIIRRADNLSNFLGRISIELLNKFGTPPNPVLGPNDVQWLTSPFYGYKSGKGLEGTIRDPKEEIGLNIVRLLLDLLRARGVPQQRIINDVSSLPILGKFYGLYVLGERPKEIINPTKPMPEKPSKLSEDMKKYLQEYEEEQEQQKQVYEEWKKQKRTSPRPGTVQTSLRSRALKKVSKNISKE